MNRRTTPQSEGSIPFSVLLIISYATVFFPRFFVSFGAPSAINFLHFGVIPVIAFLFLSSARTRDKHQKALVQLILFNIGSILIITIGSALLNDAGLVNVGLQFMLQAEWLIFLVMGLAIPLSQSALEKIRKWLFRFAWINLILAIAQSVLLPIGIYPKPKGGTLADNITGVFGGGGGSAGNYVSCTISFYFALYFWNRNPQLPLWKKLIPLFGAIYQIQVSDSKQVFIAFGLAQAILLLLKMRDPVKMLRNILIVITITIFIGWALLNLDYAFLGPYQNWINRPIWGWDGLAMRTKFAGLSIVPQYYDNPMHSLLGLGPGHSASRLGGWVLRDYDSLLLPLGATTHPATSDFWDVVSGPDGWLARESTGYFPLFTWIGLWGDLGLLGLANYLFMIWIVWRNLCVDNFCKFLMLSTLIFGCILTQMEEPGQMLTVAILIGLRWQERQRPS